MMKEKGGLFMKKHTLLLALVCSFAVSCPAYGQIGLSFNDVPVSFTDSTGRPIIDENGRTLVPLRASMESMGCTVNWYEPSRTAFVVNGDTTVSVPIGESCVYRNGVSIPNDTSAKIIDGRVYLPIRAVLEAFGASVSWDESKQMVCARYTPSAPTLSDAELRRMERELERLERQKELEEMRSKIQSESDRRLEEAKKRVEEIQNSIPDTPSQPKYDPYESLVDAGGYGNSWSLSQGAFGDFTGGYGSTYEDTVLSQMHDRYIEQSHDLP
jgi:copper amine oxidase domain protein|nr:MAG TPA: copper amine oxidase [Caudoviricetes sp.]DAX83559.1 MAG TPA: copper amine oxidase [Caudoviricetes sp.]